MKQIIQNFKTGILSVEEVPSPVVKPDGVLVRTACSLISGGTERSAINLAQKSLLGKARQRPDLVKQILSKVQRDGVWETIKTVQGRLDTHMPLGYSCSGIVTACGEHITEFTPGDRVACAGAGYANHAEVVSVPRNLVVKIADEVAYDAAAFVTVGSIALQALRVTDAQIGERVGVIGLGLVGQLTVQLLSAAGCSVFGLDILPSRAELSLRMGATQSTTGSPEEILASVMAFTRQRGLDAVLITADTENNGPVELAGDLLREKGRVVVVGAVKMDIPRRVYYQKELDLRLSRSYGPGRYDRQYEEKGIDYPFGYVRWTENRNMEAFAGLIASGKVDVKQLVTHRFSIEDALQAYDMISENKEPHLGVLLTYGGSSDSPDKRSLILQPARTGKEKSANECPGISCVGAGNFATSVLLPALKKIPGVNLRGLATAGGISAKKAGDKFKFAYCTTDISEVLGDDATDAVIIATRHNLHSQLSMQALASGKHVFVEKPLSLSRSSLKDLIGALQKSDRFLTVGFNRRFSPFARQILEDIKDRSDPLAMSYRINAGAVPEDHWTRDPVEGGGRILGEICHFVDLMTFFCGALPLRVYAHGMDLPGSQVENDTLTVDLKFQDGSIGTISYFANGDNSFSKEYLEIFQGGSVTTLEDFRKLRTIKNGKCKRFKTWRQDKGHEAGLRIFLEAVRTGSEPPICLNELIGVTLTTFCIQESMRTGQPVDIPDASSFYLSGE